MNTATAEVVEQTAIEINRPHTFKSIADDAQVTKDTVKYAYRKVRETRELGDIGEIIGNTRRFTESEASLIITTGNFTTYQTVIEAEVVDDGNPLDEFDPLAFVGSSRTYLANDDSGQVSKGEQALEVLQRQSTANHNAGVAALIKQRQNNGLKLGAMLAQVEIGTAIQEADRITADFFKNQGVSPDTTV